MISTSGSLRWWEAPKDKDSLLASPLLHWTRGRGPMAVVIPLPQGLPRSASLVRDCVNTLYFPSFPPGRHVECEEAVCKMVVGSVGGTWESPSDAHPGPQALLH